MPPPPLFLLPGTLTVEKYLRVGMKYMKKRKREDRGERLAWEAYTPPLAVPWISIAVRRCYSFAARLSGVRAATSPNWGTAGKTGSAPWRGEQAEIRAAALRLMVARGAARARDVHPARRATSRHAPPWPLPFPPSRLSHHHPTTARHKRDVLHGVAVVRCEGALDSGDTHSLSLRVWYQGPVVETDVSATLGSTYRRTDWLEFIRLGISSATLFCPFALAKGVWLWACSPPARVVW
jgi:hypothetical protein